MIIPTPEFDPMYADDGVPFRDKMLGYIEREFADVLGSHTGLLQSHQGLQVLSDMHCAESLATSRRSEAA